MRRVHEVYRQKMQRLLRQPRFIIVFLIPLLLLGFVAFKSIGSGFMPTIDEGGFTFDYIAPLGTSLAETDRLLRQANQFCRRCLKSKPIRAGLDCSSVAGSPNFYS